MTPDSLNRDLPTHLQLLETAQRIARRSECRKMRFGAVIATRDGRVLGVGYNCSVRPEQCCIREGVPSGTCLERCLAVHAEQSALIAALRVSWEADGGLICYVAGEHPDGRPWRSDGFYCTFCARLLYAAGVRWIVKPSRDERGFAVLTIEQALDSSYAVAMGQRDAGQPVPGGAA